MQEMAAKDGSAASKYFTGVEAVGPDTSQQDMKRKMMDLLNRFESGEVASLEDALTGRGLEEDDNGFDSEDGSFPNNMSDLEEKLSGLDIDSLTTAQLIALLPESELENFESQLESGEFLTTDILASAIATPWWIHNSMATDPRIQDLEQQQQQHSLNAYSINFPSVMSELVPFASLSRSTPHSSLPFNLVELLCIYSIVWRHFNGDWLERKSHPEEKEEPTTSSSQEACSFLTQLSLILKDQATGLFGYDSVESAVFGVWDRVIRMNNILLDPTVNTSEPTAKQVLTQLLQDLSLLLESRAKIVAALSDMHQLFVSSIAALASLSEGVKKKKVEMKDVKKSNLKVSRKLVFYTCFAGDANVVPDELLVELRQQADKCEFEQGALDGRDGTGGTPIDANAARQEVLKRMKTEQNGPLISEL
ncbi:UNVERIFIED_CONTAM: Zinc finger HIT domain-containing protein 2 [Siphonaria sp. JEL0065]|nr:Zinc finger HIT domain-containing protein 2 [Siphonaria sp. JEL0065]